MKISLAVIAKDEKEHIERIVKDYSQYFDEVVILCDEDITPTLSENARVEKYELSEEEKKVGHIFFDRKRNALTKLINGDYYFRLDTDDKIINPENIRPIAEKAKAQDINIVYCWYEYAKDIYGNVHAAHYRETIVKNTKDLYWNKRIHENIIPTETSTHRYVIEDSIKIEHLITAEKASSSEERNLKYLIEEYNENKENCDPRTLAYLGRMFYSIDIDRAQYFLEKHIEKSGWDEDRYMSWCFLADVMSKKGKFKDAVGCCFEAMAERQDYPNAYFQLHSIYVDQQKWDEAIHWAKIGFQIPQPKTFMLIDPASYTWRPMLSMAYCYLQVNKPEEAWELFQEVKKKCPGLNMVTKNEHIFVDAVQTKKYTDHFLWLYEFLMGKGDLDALKNLFNSIPKSLQDHEGLMTLKHQALPPVTWDKDSVVFYCGRGLVDWADPSVIRGIGGSEEAVIYLSRELVKLGYKVTVFCRCGELEGEYHGVQYLNSYKFNPKDNYNTLVSWRMNIFNFNKIKANKKYVWLHDIPQEAQFNKDKMDFDKVIVLSKYHRSLLPDFVPEDKIFYSTNGLNLNDFKGLDNIIRQDNRVIYASSYDRGLEQLLEKWPEVRKEVSDAELHIFYGWNTYNELIKVTGSNRTSDFVERIEKLMEQPGVFHHGRVGHKELLKEYTRSKVFAYPCTFPGEINCIALTKAIACGCHAVTNDFAVLPERNTHTVAQDDAFVGAIVYALKNGDSKEDVETYRKENSWETVADQWNKGLFDNLKKGDSDAGLPIHEHATKD